MDTISPQEKTKRRIIFFVVILIIAVVIFLVIVAPKKGDESTDTPDNQNNTVIDDGNNKNSNDSKSDKNSKDNKSDKNNTTDKNSNDSKNDKSNNNTNDNNKKDENNDNNTSAQKDDSSISSYSFVTDSMEVGEESIRKFNIEKISNVERQSYYEISFSLKEIDSYMCTDKDADGDCKPIKDQLKALVNVSPYVSATYKASLGAIEVKIEDVMRDNSGIMHQESRSINKKGIYRIYRSVTGRQDEEVYDVGVSSQSEFYLESKKEKDGEWMVCLYIKYPSSSTTTAENLGNTDFSKNAQDIKGGTKVNNAKIDGYSWTVVGGVYKFIWQVSAEGENPIPSVSAKLDNDKNVSISFESLTRDALCSSKVYFTDTMALECIKDGDASSYTFTGTSGYEFKLSASLSPNQVVLELKKAD